MSDINKEYDNLLNSTAITDEQVESISKVLEDNVENSEELKIIRDFPSNNNVEVNNDNEAGELKVANTILDPNTGESKIISTEDFDETIDDTSFEQLVADVESGKIKVETDDSPITEEEAKENLDAFSTDENPFDISDEALQQLLVVANKRMNKEEFNVYKELPKEIQDMIMNTIGLPNVAGSPIITTNESRAVRNAMAEQLLDEFIMKISFERARVDLNKEIEGVFKDGVKDIAEYTVGYTKERNAAYREYAENLEDEEKKAKLLETLDVIDAAYSLNELKEFAKTCKIKKYDIEEPKNYFRDFLSKYQNSSYNIYDIKLTLPILERHIVDNEKYNNADVIAFLVCFCKYIKNYKVENILEHSFMYYVIYNIVLIDSNTSEKTKDVSDTFIENIKEVIDNLKERNQFLK